MDCTSTGLCPEDEKEEKKKNNGKKTNRIEQNKHLTKVSSFTYAAVQVMMDQVKNNQDERFLMMDKNVGCLAKATAPISYRNKDDFLLVCHCNHREQTEAKMFEDWYLPVDHNDTYPMVQTDEDRDYLDQP